MHRDLGLTICRSKEETDFRSETIPNVHPVSKRGIGSGQDEKISVILSTSTFFTLEHYGWVIPLILCRYKIIVKGRVTAFSTPLGYNQNKNTDHTE